LFKALCTKNLPDVAVIPSEHFQTITWSGDNTARSYSVGFSPDLVWHKSRSTAISHGLYDSVRGAGSSYYLSSNTTSAEGGSSPSTYGYLSSFDSDGFTIAAGSDGGGDEYYVINQTGKTYVAWNWKAGTSASGTTTGSGTGQSYSASYSVNAGFSIISYTGNGTAGHTIPHHLGKKPEFIITKTRSAVEDWGIYHKDIGAGYRLKLNSTAASASNNGFWNSTEPTTSLFTVGTANTTNWSGKTYISYCWTSILGFSKVGSFIGNGSSGNFIFTGFTPAFVLIHNAGDGGGWPIADDGRGDYNSAEAGGGHPHLRAHSSGAEGDSGRIDLLSNGFRPTVNYGELNSSPFTYVYIAFAESPFKHTNAR